MDTRRYDIGMVGLGVMGRNFVLNMADHGVAVAGQDIDPAKVQALQTEAGKRDVRATASPEEFVALLRAPRAVMMLVPAGPPVDSVIRSMLPHLEPGDILIDGGNSHFTDTDVRAKAVAEKGIQYLGVGISGGEHGARYGPSLMPGGPKDAYERVRTIFEGAAARVDGDPCVTYLGPGSAGHYVKMVHNGIEYALMQIISEAYDLMKRGLSLTDDRMQTAFAEWNRGELNAYLIEITADIFGQVDDRTGRRLVDLILDEAKQLGTGRWTSQDAMDLGVPIPTVDMAVSARELSGLKTEREAASRVLSGPQERYQGDSARFVDALKNAVYAGFVVSYTQGFAQLHVASRADSYGLKLADVARIWRGGCIIRAALLEEIRDVFEDRPDLANLLVDPSFARSMMGRQEDLRTVVRAAVDLGIPVPALGASLAYFDGYRSAWLPANLIQAQRDYFGAHTYERTDVKGVFHTVWNGN